MFEIKYIKQGFDGYESWIKVAEEEWLRIDGFLEYFLTSDVKITKAFKGKMNSYLQNVDYCSKILNEFGSLILDETKFNHAKYKNWLTNNQNELAIAIQKLNES